MYNKYREELIHYIRSPDKTLVPFTVLCDAMSLNLSCKGASN